MNNFSIDKLNNDQETILNKLFMRVQVELVEELGQAAFKSWLSALRLNKLDNNILFLSLPSNFLSDWVIPHYGNKIDTICKRIFVGIKKTKIIVNSTVKYKDSSFNDFEDLITKRNLNNNYPSPLDPRFNFSNFIIGKSNEFSYAAAKKVAESTKVTFNPLFLFGGVGLGKTHLMHAVAWDIQERNPKRRVVYLSAEKFMYEFVNSLRHKDIMTFKEKFRSVDVLMIDDIQFIAGKDSTQEEFFHTFNSLVDQKKQIIVSGDRSPSDLDGVEERLKSRLSFGVVAELNKADYELRLRILKSKVQENKNIEVDNEIIQHLAKNITSNVRELEGALRRLCAHVELVNRPLTIDTTKQILHDIFKANKKSVTIEEIQKKVSEYFNIRQSDMLSTRRSRIIARPRQIAMYLSKICTTKSLPEIGKRFGGRDHTTVIHAVKKVESLYKTDTSFSEHINVLKKSFY